jgi:hypothetical protein
MKKSYMIALSALLIGSAVPAFAADAEAPAPATDLSAANPHGYPLWHCTGYAVQGGGYGGEAFDYDYQNAYYRALYDCQSRYGYCQVACHQDWH